MSIPVRQRTKIPRRLPDYDNVLFVYERAVEGWSVIEILDAYTDEFLSTLQPSRRHRQRDLARYWIREVVEDPRPWDPRLDEIAIERAYDGDAEVWLGLTYYERRECLDRLVFTYDNKTNHRMWPHLPVVEGFGQWCRKVGEPQDRVPNISLKRRQRAAGGKA
jgi:hypothetical protein